MQEHSVAHERIEHYAKLPEPLAGMAADCQDAIGLALFYLSIGRRPPANVLADVRGPKRSARIYLSPAADRFRQQLMERHGWSKAELFTEALRLISANPVLKGGKL